MNKNVLKKLSKIESKVELAEVKVDLALADDIKTMTAKATTIANELLKASKSTDLAKIELDKITADYNKQLALVLKIYPDAVKFKDAEETLTLKALKSTADLGIDIYSIPSFKEFESAGTDVQVAINNAKKYTR